MFGWKEEGKINLLQHTVAWRTDDREMLSRDHWEGQERKMVHQRAEVRSAKVSRPSLKKEPRPTT